MDCRVASELGTLHDFLGDDFTGTALEGPLAVLVGQPGRVSPVGKPAWVAYESGDIVLARSTKADDIHSAVGFHLASLAAATASIGLPLRLRPILTPDDTVVLVEPSPIHDLAGNDRRLLRRGFRVLPTTVVRYDSGVSQVKLPAQRFDPTIGAGGFPVVEILLRDRGPSALPAADLVLALARSVLKFDGIELERVARDVEDLSRAGIAMLLSAEEIRTRVDALGSLRS